MAGYKEKDTIERTELGDILLNRRGSEFIRIARIEDTETGEVQYDIRRWYYNKDDEETATPKGLRLKEDMLMDIINIVNKDRSERGVADENDDETDEESGSAEE